MIKLKERFLCLRSLRHYLSNERGIIGTTAAIILASGSRSASKTEAEAQNRALSAQEKAAQEAEDRRNEAVRLKQEAAKNIHFPTFLETPEAQKYKGTLEERMAGRGLIDVNASTSPVADQIRSGLRETQAGISATASARGLGRSTIPVSQTREASQAAERDIAERMSQLEIVRQEQIGQAVGQFGALSETESISQQNQARFKQGAEFEIADTMMDAANQTKNDQFAISNTIAQNGASAASYQLLNSQIWASGLIAAGQSLENATKQSTEDIIDTIESEQSNRNSALVARA